jgi:hypothetical protein
MRKTLLLLTMLAGLAACASRTEAPACRGNVFDLNAVEAAR